MNQKTLAKEKRFLKILRDRVRQYNQNTTLPNNLKNSTNKKEENSRRHNNNRMQRNPNYVVHSISFQTFCVQAYKIVVDSWKFNIFLQYILWDDWPIMISGSNELQQQQLEYILLKPDCHSWWISKMQSGREDTLEERYAIKFCFKLGKNSTERYGMLHPDFQPSCMNQASVFEWHKRFKQGKESVRDDERCDSSKEVNTPEFIGQRVRVRVTMLRF